MNYFKEIRERLIHIEEKINAANPGQEREAESFHHCGDQWWGGFTYAQHGDDLIILNIFHTLGIRDFRYLDIGAHHPYHISNTALLYEQGHRGINIEANPNLIALFQKYRPEDQNINVGVGTQEGVLPFYMIDDFSGRNTFSREAAEAFVREYPEFSITQILQIPVVTLQDILERYCRGVFPDFLSMDVEGLDYAILQSIDVKNKPKIIDVEVEFAGGDNSHSIVALLREKGYFPYFRAGSNLIFVDCAWREALL